MVYECINLHFTDFCNYKCIHCFVNKENYELSLENIKICVDRIKEYFEKNGVKGRINIAGGEPLISRNINEIIDYIYSKGISISIITNGYYLSEEFIKRNSKKISSIGISVDSINNSINKITGSCFGEKTIDYQTLVNNCLLIKKYNMKLKINTCLTKFNIDEDFTNFLRKIKPDRYKVLEVVCSNETKYLKPAEDKFLKFIKKHSEFITVVERDYEMDKSYIIVDSKGNLSTNNYHINNYSLIDNSIEKILEVLEIDDINYLKRYT